ncbi:MAG: hypothetical protein SFY81_03525 [Verrucomicrobiota bacterium]|nr:hypothetical protein [Verrucomicrobiota bacterium]
MKLLLFFICLAISLSGCGKKDEPGLLTTNNSSGNPVTAPVDYLGGVAQAKKVAEKTVNTASINQAIQIFHTEQGRYPKDLNELMTQKYLTQTPPPPYGMQFVYNPTNGQFKVVAK